MCLSWLASFQKKECPWIRAKFKDMLSLDTTTSDIDIHSFVGLVGYYRNCIEGFLKIIKAMTKSFRKD
jgi:hypothetical protein